MRRHVDTSQRVETGLFTALLALVICSVAIEVLLEGGLPADCSHTDLRMIQEKLL